MPLWGAWSVLVVGAVSVVVTAAYCTRLWLRTFAGTARDAAAVGRAHEPGPWMQAPLWLLAVPTVLLGGGALLGSGVAVWTGGGTERLTPALTTTLVSLAALLVGAGTVALVWRRSPAADPAVAIARRAFAPMAAGFGVDRFYDEALVRPTRVLANVTVAADGDLVDGTDATGVGTTGLGRRLRRGQDGNPQRYLTVGLGGFAVAAAVFVAALAAIGGGV